MAIPANHPTLKEKIISTYSPSIGTSPVVSYLRVPFTGAVKLAAAIAQGAITTADCSIAIARNGTAIATLTLPVASAAGGQMATVVPAAFTLGAVTEEDVISFTPSGASGAGIACQYTLAIQAGA